MPADSSFYAALSKAISALELINRYVLLQDLLEVFLFFFWLLLRNGRRFFLFWFSGCFEADFVYSFLAVLRFTLFGADVAFGLNHACNGTFIFLLFFLIAAFIRAILLFNGLFGIDFLLLEVDFNAVFFLLSNPLMQNCKRFTVVQKYKLVNNTLLVPRIDINLTHNRVSFNIRIACKEPAHFHTFSLIIIILFVIVFVIGVILFKATANKCFFQKCNFHVVFLCVCTFEFLVFFNISV